jgi:hypothetical protein
MPRFIAVAAAASIATLSAVYGGESSTSRPHPAVVCTSESGSPWIVKARGTLTRTKSKSEVVYALDLGTHSYTWRFVTKPDGSTTTVGPGFLTDRLAPTNAPQSRSDLGPRGQRLYVTGEIHEYAGPTILSLAVGSRCPTSVPKLLNERKGSPGTNSGDASE